MRPQEASSRSQHLRTASAVVLAAGVLVGGGYALAPRLMPPTPAAAASPGEQAVPVTVATIEPRAATVWEEFSGRLEAVDQLDVRARVGGAIQQIHFHEGELVAAGDLLVTIDPAPYAAEVQRLEAQVAGAEARLALTASDLERGQRLWDQRIVTARDLDTRSNASKEARAALDGAKAALETARINLGWTQVRAAVGGRVGRREITTGNLVAAGSASPALTTVMSVDPIYATFDADEGLVLKSLAATAEPSGARGTLASIPVAMTTADGRASEGRLQFIDNRVNTQTGTVRARAVFGNGDGRLIPGQFARMRLGSPKPEQLVLIDERAIGTDQDKKFVFVVGADDRAAFRAVTVGRTVEGLRVVTAGLHAGERIVVNGVQRVRPGALVKPEAVAMGARSAPGTGDAKPRQLAQR